MRFSRAHLSLALLAGLVCLSGLTWSPLVAQSASFSVFGTSCAPGPLRPGPHSRIRSTGLPVIGTSFSIDYDGLSSILFGQEWRPVLLFGFASANVPFDGITPLQPPGCSLQIQPVGAILMPSAGRDWQRFMIFPIPVDHRLLGQSFLAQWVLLGNTCASSGCTLEFLLASNVGRATIGF